jgi:HSP20 family protein
MSTNTPARYVDTCKHISVPSIFFSPWDKLLEDFFEPVSRLPSTLISSSFPPCDVSIDSENNLKFEMSVAGYLEDEVDVKLEDDKLILTLEKVEKEEKEEDKKWKLIQRGIKQARSQTVYSVPSSKYDTSKVSASLKDGILTIEIPAREETKPVSIKITK